MGIFNATVKLRNATSPSDLLEIPAKVDTGATLLVLPQTIADRLKLTLIRRQRVKYANEETSNSHFEVARASSLASSRGVPPRIASNGETPSELAAGTAALRRQNENCCAETADRDVVGVVELEVCGRKGWFEALVEPKKTYALLGAVVMETLDLIVEPREMQIYPNPRSVLPMAEIE